MTANQAAREHITQQRTEEIFKLADEIRRAPSRFTKDFVIENLADGIFDLCGLIDRLRAQLSETEWRVEWGTPGKTNYEIEAASDEGNARYLAGRSPSARIQTRQATPWRDAEEADRG